MKDYDIYCRPVSSHWMHCWRVVRRSLFAVRALFQGWDGVNREDILVKDSHGKVIFVRRPRRTA
jgi:hypothetical protein